MSKENTLLQHMRGKTPRRPFVVDIDAAVVRRLGKNAAALYQALRRLADGKSGELRFRERWYKAKEFDREAKMCERVRLAAMWELVAVGLVTFTRPRVRLMIGGRLRAVAGSVHYVVHRQPVPPEHRQKIKDPSKLHLQNCISGSLLEMQSQIVSNPPVGSGSVSVLPFSENPSDMDNHHHPKPDEDDNVSTKEFSTSTPKTKPSVEETAKAKNIPPDLRPWIDTRILARAQGLVRNRGAYLLASRPAFLEDLGEEIELYLQERAEKFMAQCIREKGSVDSDSVCDFLQSETEKHNLPVGKEGEDAHESEQFSVTREEPLQVFCRIYDNAAEVLGLGDVDEGDQRQKCPKCGASVPRSAIEAHAKVCRAVGLRS